MIFTEKRHGRQHPPPPPQRPYDVSCGQNRYVTLPYTGSKNVIQSEVTEKRFYN